jgi:hypothetical protein
LEKENGVCSCPGSRLRPGRKGTSVEYWEDNTPEDAVEYTDTLEEFQDIFAWNMAEMTTIKDEQFRISVTDPTPVLRQYRLLYAEKEILAEQMEERKAAGFIRPLMPEYGASVTMPPKKVEFENWTL